MTKEEWIDKLLNREITLWDIPEALLDNDIYYAAVKTNTYYFSEVPRTYLTEEICKIAVKNTGWNLQFVPHNLINYELCKLAVTKDGIYLQFIPMELRTEELCNLAANTWQEAERFAPPGTSLYNNVIMKKALL